MDEPIEDASRGPSALAGPRPAEGPTHERRKDILRSLVGLWLVITAILVGWMASGRASAAAEATFEFWLTIGLVGCVGSHPSAIRVIRSVGLLGVVPALVIGGMLFGQFGPLSARETYPFVAWDMYTSPIGSTRFIELRGVDGEERDLGSISVARFAPTPSPRAFLNNIARQARAAASQGEPYGSRVEEIVRQIGQDAKMPSLHAIVVVDCQVSPPLGNEPSACRDLLRVELDDRGAE